MKKRPKVLIDMWPWSIASCTPYNY